jgi:hypothetical protein
VDGNRQVRCGCGRSIVWYEGEEGAGRGSLAIARRRVTEGRREDECGCRGGQGAEERNGGSGSRVSAIGPQTNPTSGQRHFGPGQQGIVDQSRQREDKKVKP